MDYNVISLFSGAMGLDIGLAQAGLKIAISQDYDSNCINTMKANNHLCVHGDIQKLIENDPECDFLLNPCGLNKDEIFAVVGGPPCQPFSTAGKRLGIHDPRGSLFMQFAYVIEKIRPRFFVMENVRGLISSKIDPSDPKNNKTALDVIKERFKDMGYKIVYDILDAVDYGVPQFRERLIIIGSRDQEDIFLPKPTHFKIHQNKNFRWTVVGDVIDDIKDNPGPCVDLVESRKQFLKYVPMGGNWKDMPKHIQEEAMGGAYNSGGGKTGFYRRLNYNEPSPTLVTSPVQKATMLCHPEEDRPLSIKEYKRIQQFPDNWILEGKLASQYRQIGNAVPIGLGKAIGETLISIAKNESEIHSKRK